MCACADPKPNTCANADTDGEPDASAYDCAEPGTDSRALAGSNTGADAEPHAESYAGANGDAHRAAHSEPLCEPHRTAHAEPHAGADAAVRAGYVPSLPRCLLHGCPGSLGSVAVLLCRLPGGPVQRSTKLRFLR